MRGYKNEQPFLCQAYLQKTVVQYSTQGGLLETNEECVYA